MPDLQCPIDADKLIRSCWAGGCISFFRRFTGRHWWHFRCVILTPVNQSFRIVSKFEVVNCYFRVSIGLIRIFFQPTRLISIFFQKVLFFETFLIRKFDKNVQFWISAWFCHGRGLAPESGKERQPPAASLPGNFCCDSAVNEFCYTLVYLL